MSNSRRSVPVLVGLIFGVIFALVDRTTAQNLTVRERDWWEDTIVYQVWTRSFQDSDGDGIGDLQGVINRLDHFEELGVETIWLNTIYPSPLYDSGFDLTDYENVDSTYGSLETFDALIAAAHYHGIKVILDYIPNHSSIEHPWFNASVYRVEPYSDYYIWHNGTIDANGSNVAPNNWASFFSNDEESSAWEWNSVRQQWYLHQFTVNEADFNLRNEDVMDELLNVLDFWLDRGVDGFYINNVPYFLEEENFTDNPTDATNNSFGLDENVNLLYRFREHVESWVSLNDHVTKFLVAEGFEDDENLIAYYGNDTNEGVAPVNVHFIAEFDSSSNASHIKSKIDSWISALPSNRTSNWKLSSQDYSRIAIRYGLNRADGLNMFVLALPGRVFTYYGEEIAMLDNQDISFASTVDTVACNYGETRYAEVSRDPYRTPMHWDTTTSAGFSTSSSPYLPVHTSYATRNVASQLASELSNVNTYKAIAALRSTSTFIYGSYEIEALNNDKILVLRRSLDDSPMYILVVNLGLARETVNLTEVFADLPNSLNIAVISANAVFSGTTVTPSEFILTANAAVLLTDAAIGDDNNEEETFARSKRGWRAKRAETEPLVDNKEEESTTMTTEVEDKITASEASQTESMTTEVEENTETTTQDEQTESTMTEDEGNTETTTQAEQTEPTTIEDEEDTETTTQAEQTEPTTTEDEENVMTTMTTTETEENEPTTTEVEENDSTEALENEATTTESADNSGFATLSSTVGLVLSLCFSFVSFHHWSF